MYRSALMLWLLLASGAPLVAGPALEPGGLELTATPAAVGVELVYSGDDNGNASALLQWRRAGEADWRNGVEPTVDRRHRRMWASIWPLEQGDVIEVMFTPRDPDAPAVAPLRKTTTVRTLVLRNAGGRTMYVSPGGNDDGPGTRQQPFQTVAHAAARARPGDTVLLLSGTYHEGGLCRGLKGLPDRPIVIAAAEGQVPILDGSVTIARGSPGWKPEGKDQFSIALPGGVDAVSYLAQDGLRMHRQPSPEQLRDETRRVRRAWHVDPKTRRLHVRTGGKPAREHAYALARHDYGLWLSGSSHLVIRGLTLRNYGAAAVRLSEGAEGCTILGCTLYNAPGGFFLKGETTRHNVIWRNELYEPGLVDFPWGVIKESDAARQGIFCVAGRGTSICHNRIHGWFDGAAIESWKRPDQLELNRDCDFMFNEIYNIGDDAIEADGGGVNLRIHGNRIRNAHTAISLAPVERGPVYCTRNEATFKAMMFKLNVAGCTSPGCAYTYHNTGYCLVTGADGGTAISFPPTIPCSNKVFLNNVIIANEWAVRAGRKGYTLNGNCYFHVPGKPPRKLQWEKKSYPTIDAFRRATGQEGQGIYGDPLLASTPDLGKIPSARDWLTACPSDDPLARDAKTADLRLREGSPCIDSGLRIRGINEDHRGAGPDRGAWEFHEGGVTSDQ